MTQSSTAARPAGADLTRLALPVVRPVVTYILLAVIIGVFVLSYILDQTAEDPQILNPIFAYGVMDYNSILYSGQWYRLVTAMFIHLSMAHIFFNGLTLWRFGQMIEGLFGHARFIIVYFFSGLAGSLASFLIGRGASAGASGAIFGIVAAEMVFLYRHRELLGAAAGAALRELLVLAGINLGLGILTAVAPGGVRIDNWAHVGGFVAGLVISSAIAPRYTVVLENNTPVVVDEAPITTRWPLAVACMVLLAAIGVAGYLLLPR